jgi:Fe-S-cluster containining protein
MNNLNLKYCSKICGGKCCHGNVFILPQDLKTLLKKFSTDILKYITFKKVKNLKISYPHSIKIGKNYYFLCLKKINGHCSFFDIHKGMCRIYKIRPLVCRITPRYDFYSYIKRYSQRGNTISGLDKLKFFYGI